MNPSSLTYAGGPIFDGTVLHMDRALRVQDGKVVGLIDAGDVSTTDDLIDLKGDILSPGYVDLQVNGGGGVMFNDDPSVPTLTQIAQAHRQLGVVRLLPTLITDTPEKTSAAIEAAAQAVQAKTAGIAGLHLEGPHLSVARKGAHDAQYIRPMDDADLHALRAAKQRLPILKVTIAPENVTPDQVAALAAAGIIVSLGHTDASFETCLDYAKAGASCVTHLFNAMSQMTSRAPGVVGAALHSGALAAGLIADGIHVHPAAMRMAFAAKTGPGALFLVSDAMAVAGTEQEAFELDGRVITRHQGQLRLANGTLAGADLTLTRAVATLVQQVGVPLADALAAATRLPARLVGLAPCGVIRSGMPASDLIVISSDLTTALPLDEAEPQS